MTFQLVPEKIVFGGAALGHHDGQPVLIARAVPGERLEVEPVRTARGMIHARIVRVVDPSPGRVQAPCPYFGACGGCHYQHLPYEREVAWKLTILRETLRRVGGITWENDILARTAFPWQYRNQAQLKVGVNSASEVIVGFFESESHHRVDVEFCRILSPCLNRTLEELRRHLSPELAAGCHEIEMMADDTDSAVMLRFHGALTARAKEALAQAILGAMPAVQTVAFEDGQPLILGSPALVYSAGDFRYRISPGSFFQASRFLAPQLVSAVTGAACETANRALALDLYSGVGLFTLPLASHFEQVMGVESHRGAAADLAANLRAHRRANARSIHQSVFQFLRRYAGPHPDLVVLDPPRSGVGLPALEALAKLRARRIIYVSCHPPTLARDLATLTRQGYWLETIEMFDFFPQPFHPESLAILGLENTLSR